MQFRSAFRRVTAVALGAAASLAATAFTHVAAAQTTVTIEGQITSSRTHAPISNVVIVVRLADDSVRSGSRHGGLSDETGRYSISGIAPGTYTISVRRVGLGQSERRVILAAGQLQRENFELAEAATVIAPTVVSATRETQRRTEASATIDVLDGAEVRLARAAHPAQIMKRVPGVYVSQLSAEGHSMAIRQPITTKPMYLYLEDGIPTRATGFFNHNALYEVNLPQAGGIEVLKGPGTALYGSDAIGGVVNVLTRPAPIAPSLETTVEGGAYGYARLLVTGGETRGNDGFRADANATRVDGWRDASPYTRYSGTMRWDHIASGYTARTVLTGSTIDQNDILTVNQSQFDARSSINRSPLAYRKVRALRLSTAVEGERGQSLWSITPFARYNVLDILPSWQLTFDPQTWDQRNTSLGFLAKYRRGFTPMRARVIAGTDVDFSPGSFTADSSILTRSGTGTGVVYQSYAPGARQYDYDVTYRSVSPYVHTEASPIANLRLDAGLRYDVAGYDYRTRLAPTQTGRHRIPGNTTRTYERMSPKFGATYEMTPSFNLYASYRAGFRAPSQGQLFQQNQAANTVDLKPVTVTSVESGVRGQYGSRLVYQLAAYDMFLHDDIISFQAADGQSIATNAGETRHRGIEGSVGAALSAGLRLDVAWSVSRQKYVSWVPQAATPATATKAAQPAASFGGNLIEQAPADLGNVLLTWTPHLLRGGRLAAEYSHAGRYAMDPQNTHFYGGHDLFTLHGNVNVRQNAELFARVVNVTNANYAEVATYNTFQKEQYNPGTPRSVYAGLRYNWR